MVIYLAALVVLLVSLVCLGCRRLAVDYPLGVDVFLVDLHLLLGQARVLGITHSFQGGGRAVGVLKFGYHHLMLNVIDIHLRELLFLAEDNDLVAFVLA